MSFATYIARGGDLAIFVYVYVGGLPYVFSNAPQPTAWTLPTGMSWSQTLVLSKEGGTNTSLRSVGQSVDTQTGILAAGMADLEFVYDPWEPSSTWANLIAPTTRTTMYLDPANLTRPSNFITFLADGSDVSYGEDWYAGKETVRFDSGTFINATGRVNFEPSVGRGRYGSTRQWYGPRGPDGATAGGPVEVTSWPDSWRGRQIRVYLEACEVDQHGALIAKSSAIRSIDGLTGGDHSREVFRGQTYDLVVNDDRATVTLQCQSLTQYLEAPVMSRGRIFRAGPTVDDMGWVYVEENGPRYLEIAGNTDSTLTSIDGDVDIWNELGGFDQLVSVGELINTANRALSDAYGDGITAGDRMNFEIVIIDDDGDPRAEIGANYYLHPSGYGSYLPIDVTLQVEGRHTRAQSLWPALGVTKNLTIAGREFAIARGAIPWSTVLADEPMPHYYFSEASSRLYYQAPAVVNTLTDDPPDMQRTRKRTGEIDGVFLKLHEEIVEVRMRSGGVILTDGSFYYAEVIRRGSLTTTPHALTIPYDDRYGEEGVIQAVIGFDDHRVLDAVRYVAISNGDSAAPVSNYNVLPEGFGGGIPEDMFDHDTWDRAQDEIGAIATGWVIDETTSVRDLLDTTCKALGLVLYERQTDTGVKLAVVRAFAPMLSARTKATIDDGWVNSEIAPPQPSASESQIVNTINVKYSYDPIEREFRHTDLKYLDQASIAKYGLSDPMVVDVPWAHSVGDVRGSVEPLAVYLSSLYGRRQAILVVSSYSPRSWDLQAMDTVAVTQPYIPNWLGGGLGITGLRGLIVRADHDYSAEGDAPFSEVTILLRASNLVFAPYIPSIRLLAHVSGSTYSIRRDVNEGGFGAPGADDNDAEVWQDAADQTWKVRAYLPFKDRLANHESRTVTAIDVTSTPPTITLSSALTGDNATYAGQVVLTFEPFDVAGGLASGQEPFVFLSREKTLGSSVNTYQLTRADASTSEGVRWR